MYPDKGFSKLLLPHMGQSDMKIDSVAVIGAGTMGSGIAQVCAQTGWKTWLFDVNREGLERSCDSIDAYWRKGIELKKQVLMEKTNEDSDSATGPR